MGGLFFCVGNHPRHAFYYDAFGAPVENALVDVGSGPKIFQYAGITDKNGLWTYRWVSRDELWGTIKKDGYYETTFSHLKLDYVKKNDWAGRKFPLQITLNKKINLEPMYAKNTYGAQDHLKVPVLKTPVGYDLEKGDWVAPYGKGQISDFIFSFKIRFVSRGDWDASYTLTFSNENDGIQEYLPVAEAGIRSFYNWPYEAPLDGYKKEIMWSAKNYTERQDIKSKSDPKKNRQYIFRVRTKTDQNNKITEAKYGKISGDISVWGDGSIAFTYYFNPSGNRSLAYDWKHPLYKWNLNNREHEVHGL